MNDAELAQSLVTDAAELAARMRSEGVDTSQKTSVADVVTAADIAAEALVRSTLDRERPGDGLLGEEGTAFEAATGRRWIIDPVDGTYNFVAGLANWCSAVALEVDGRLAVGAVRRPVADETWVASDGRTTLNGVDVSAIADAPLAQVGVATFLNEHHLVDQALTTVSLAVIRAAATVRIGGSGSCDLADVAAGRLGLWIQSDVADWDWLPGRALVEGAGGAAEVVEHRGHRWHLAGRPTAVAQAREVIAAC